MKKYILKLVPVFIVFLLFLLFLLPGKLIKITAINCTSQFGQCSNKISDPIQEFEGDNLNAVRRQLREFLLSEVLVEDFNIQYTFPGSINISLVEKVPKYTLRNNEQKTYANVDTNGFILSHTDNSELPVVTVFDPLPHVGSSVNDNRKFVLDLLYDLFLTFQIKEGIMKNNSLVIEMPDNLRVIFPIEGDRDVLVGSLVLLFSKYQNKNNLTADKGTFDIAEIDLRFNNPVLRTSVSSFN